MEHLITLFLTSNAMTVKQTRAEIYFPPNPFEIGTSPSTAGWKSQQQSRGSCASPVSLASRKHSPRATKQRVKEQPEASSGQTSTCEPWGMLIQHLKGFPTFPVTWGTTWVTPDATAETCLSWDFPRKAFFSHPQKCLQMSESFQKAGRNIHIF